MASVRKREWTSPKGEKRSAYVVSYRDQSGVRRAPQFEKKHQADEYRRKIERELFEGIHTAAATSRPISAIADAFIRDCMRRHRIGDRMSGNTLDLARRLVDVHVKPAFGQTRACDVTSKQVREFVDSKSETYSRVTVTKLVKHLRDILQFAVAEGDVRRNVVRDEPPRVPLPAKERIEIPSIEQLRRLFDVIETMMESDHKRLPKASRRQKGMGPLQTAIAVYLALTGGLRRGEVAALRWENVDLVGDVIRVRHSLSRFDGLKAPKSKAGVRDVPIVPFLKRHLLQLRKEQGGETDGYVIRNCRGGPMAADEVARWLWEPVAEAADIRRRDGSLMGMHALRHAAASLWIRAGVPDLVLKKAIGHASISTTKDVYGHVFADDQDGRRLMLQSASHLMLTAQPAG